MKGLRRRCIMCSFTYLVCGPGINESVNRNMSTALVMISNLTSLPQCIEFSGLTRKEIFLGVIPSARHRSLYTSYLLFLPMGAGVVRKMIVTDIRSFLDLGATKRAADLLITLRWLLFDYADARLRKPDDA